MDEIDEKRLIDICTCGLICHVKFGVQLQSFYEPRHDEHILYKARNKLIYARCDEEASACALCYAR